MAKATQKKTTKTTTTRKISYGGTKKKCPKCGYEWK